jgi:hypothetical protein
VRTGLNPVAISDQNEHASPPKRFRNSLVCVNGYLGYLTDRGAGGWQA